ncbi:MAG: hypothetical protein JXR84_13035 [Anaerolineae bacterium]|nr:hypothetical protein [Anaerolineae bacterium]
MPRAKPFRCHTCGTLYTGGRCPKCYPKKSKRRRAGWGSSGGQRGRRTAASVLGHAPWPVNVDVPDATAADESAMWGERPTDGTCTTTPELQVQEWDGEEAVSVAPPPADVADATR